MTADHRTAFAALACIGLLLVAACGGGDDPDLRPTRSITSTPTQTTTAPTWQSKFTEEQLRAYQEALARWDDYQEASAPIWAKGKYTKDAESVFKQYWHVPQLMEDRLRTSEAADAQVTGTWMVLSSQPTLATASDMRIRQCIDASQVTVTIKGKVQKGATHPFQRVIEMDKPEGHPWLIVRVRDPAAGWMKTCAA